MVYPSGGIGHDGGQAEGMVKILIDDETEELLGGHSVGAEATELIHEILLAKSSELLPADVIHMMHAHPTLSEGIVEAMRGAIEGPIHISIERDECLAGLSAKRMQTCYFIVVGHVPSN